MQTSIEHYGDVVPSDLFLLVAIRGWLDGLPDKGNLDHDGRHLWSCHSVCRAAVSVFGLSGRGWEFRDGFFVRPAFNHCWLVRKTEGVTGRDNCTVVIDVLPVAAAGGPFIASIGNWSSPWFDAYGTKAYSGADLARFVQEADALVQVTKAMRG